jgi:hypothetical protein
MVVRTTRASKGPEKPRPSMTVDGWRTASTDARLREDGV